MKAYMKALEYMPERLKIPLAKFPKKECVTEIRLRKGLPLSLTTFYGNILLDDSGNTSTFAEAISATGDEIRYTVTRFCEGSVYRYMDTAKDGFIVNDDGFRLGICHLRKTLSPESLPEVYGAASLRIPRFMKGASAPIKAELEKKFRSMLIVSEPGAGKTTLIRDLAISLSTGKSAKRCVVIDEKREIFPAGTATGAGLCDVIPGCPKKIGIETALRIFSPEVIICDEVSSEEDSRSVISATGAGVFVFATAHADSIYSVMKKKYLSELIATGAIETIAVLKRENGASYRSEITFGGAV